MDPVERQVMAYNAHDLEAFVACYSADIVIEDGEGKRILQGREAMRDMYGRTFESSPNTHGEIVSRIRVGQYVIDEERVSGIETPGQPREVHAVVVYRLKNDLIVHARFLH